jgi:hypothetical protein
VKPHLFYLAFGFLAYWVLVERKWKVVLWASVGFGLLVAADRAQLPARDRARWVEALATQPPIAWPSARSSHRAHFVFSLTGGGRAVAARVIPGITTAAFVAWLALVRPTRTWSGAYRPSSGLSLFTAPTGGCSTRRSSS